MVIDGASWQWQHQFERHCVAEHNAADTAVQGL